MIPSTPKLVSCFTSAFFTTRYATQQVDETFAVTVQIIIDFICRLSHKARKSISYLYSYIYLTPQVTTPIMFEFVSIMYSFDLSV